LARAILLYPSYNGQGATIINNKSTTYHFIIAPIIFMALHRLNLSDSDRFSPSDLPTTATMTVVVIADDDDAIDGRDRDHTSSSHEDYVGRGGVVGSMTLHSSTTTSASDGTTLRSYGDADADTDDGAGGGLVAVVPAGALTAVVGGDSALRHGGMEGKLATTTRNNGAVVVVVVLAQQRTAASRDGGEARDDDEEQRRGVDNGGSPWLSARRRSRCSHQGSPRPFAQR